MENIIDLIVTDSPASNISDAIKNALYAKAADKINSIRPLAASSLFDNENETTQDES